MCASVYRTVLAVKDECGDALAAHAGLRSLTAARAAMFPRRAIGRDVPVRYVVEQHIKEDCGGIVPSVADWLSRIRPETWMSRGYSLPPGDPPIP